MADGVDHAAQRLGVRTLHRLADAAQADRAQRVALTAGGAVGRLDLGDDERAHDVVTSSAEVSTVSSEATGTSSPLVESTTGGLPPRPRTLSTERPRRAAISSGLRRSWRPAIVALTRLIGFWDPSDFERMSWIPGTSAPAGPPPRATRA